MKISTAYDLVSSAFSNLPNGAEMDSMSQHDSNYFYAYTTDGKPDPAVEAHIRSVIGPLPAVEEDENGWTKGGVPVITIVGWQKVDSEGNAVCFVVDICSLDAEHEDE